MTEAFICDAIRTPIGRFGGALSNIRADDLAALPIQALIARHPKVDWAKVDEVILGAANQAGEDNRNAARMALLLAGLPETVPGVTVNRLCASGLEAVANAARLIKGGEAGLVIAGGSESMSRAPFVLGKAERGLDRAQRMEDTTMGWRFINPAMKAAYGVDSMPETAENLAADFSISRQDQDAFAYRSQQRCQRAVKEGRLALEIQPVMAGKIEVTQDEHPRADTTLEALANLGAPFRKDGTVTAGNSSGINDGAAALLIADEKTARAQGLVPRARILGAASAGVAPRIMGLGPVPATQKLLAHLGLTLKDFDVIEINEAFAAQVLACTRQLGLADDAAEVNPHGGAIALGHPLGMTGARLAMTAMQELERRAGKRALVTLCIGVGQGLALAIERV